MNPEDMANVQRDIDQSMENDDGAAAAAIAVGRATASRRVPGNNQVVNHFHFNLSLSGSADMWKLSEMMFTMLSAFIAPRQQAGSAGPSMNIEEEAGPSQSRSAVRKKPVESSTCCICRDNMPTALLYCGHVFCDTCASKLISHNIPCAICRAPFEEWTVLAEPQL